VKFRTKSGSAYGLEVTKEPTGPNKLDSLALYEGVLTRAGNAEMTFKWVSIIDGQFESDEIAFFELPVVGKRWMYIHPSLGRCLSTVVVEIEE
jgi:hypothetical protein